jgi:hypothetical protein
VFAIRSLAAWELSETSFGFFEKDTDGFMLGPVLITAAVSYFYSSLDVLLTFS